MTNPDINRDTPLEIALLSLRIGLAILFIVWAFDKLLQPEHAKAILAGFYGQNAETMAGYIPLTLGGAQLLVTVIFVLGMFKTLSYGALLVMHLVSTVVSLKMHLEPFAIPNILFWANWPILGAAIALFVLRGRDKLLSVH